VTKSEAQAENANLKFCSVSAGRSFCSRLYIKAYSRAGYFSFFLSLWGFISIRATALAPQWHRVDLKFRANPL